MTRAQCLGIMAAQLMSAIKQDGGMSGDDMIANFVKAADELLREAERVSPEPRNAMDRSLQAWYDRDRTSQTVHVPEKP